MAVWCVVAARLLIPGIGRRFGNDRVILFSLALLGLALVLRALAGSSTSLLLSTFLVGIGVAISGPLIGGWIKSHFASKAALLMGIYAAGLGVGATMAAVGSEYVALADGGWRLAAGVWAILCVFAIVSWQRLASVFPSRSHAGPASTAIISQAPARTGRAWLIAVYFGLSQFVCYACFAWVGESSRELAINTLGPGINLGIFTAVVAASSFFSGIVTRSTADRRGWLTGAAVLSALGAALLWLSPHALGVIPVVAIALGQGTCFALAMTLPLDNTTSHEEASQWTAFMLFIGYLTAAVGPFAFGFLRDRTGTFEASYGLLVAASLALLLLTPMLKPRQHEADSVQGAAFRTR
ncbi:MFS transporter [Pseudomonas gingeri]|uniref:MFS transporter n=1 Tax=Pseudomonas gingeri TaxID=117681 RepID=A0A7Y7YAX9_9PSED|nr:MFS transporter [Pseudomonas gingeri]NWB26515.1 MFS transporter [Pseudomonas gingeri]NWC32935.1 MFS transporter [Pseudomonas gingeri]NWD06887.1 MFS transporter [Pseudomonas gingeri]NWE31485.1 MFS transporter [Pseudomonas gingeri]NWE57497.1 MFS transporter [Pseudomonas gingeri]